MDSIVLPRGVPQKLSVSKGFTIVQNTMPQGDGGLMMALHDQPDKKWITIEEGNMVKLEEDVYLMQKSKTKWEFPVMEFSS